MFHSLTSRLVRGFGPALVLCMLGTANVAVSRPTAPSAPAFNRCRGMVLILSHSCPCTVNLFVSMRDGTCDPTRTIPLTGCHYKVTYSLACGSIDAFPADVPCGERLELPKRCPGTTGVILFKLTCSDCIL
jgi:hypothetical protein